MAGKPTYEEMKQRVKELGKEATATARGSPIKGLVKRKNTSPVEKVPPFLPLAPTPAPVRYHFHPPGPRPLLLSHWFWLSPAYVHAQTLIRTSHPSGSRPLCFMRDA